MKNINADMLWIGFSQGCSRSLFDREAKDFQSGMTIYYAKEVTEIGELNPGSACNCGDCFSNDIKRECVMMYTKEFKNIKLLNGQHFDMQRMREDFYRIFWDVLTKKYPGQFKVCGNNAVFKTNNYCECECRAPCSPIIYPSHHNFSCRRDFEQCFSLEPNTFFCRQRYNPEKSQGTGESLLQVENIIKDFTENIGTLYTFEANEVNKEETDHFPLSTSGKTNTEIERWLREA